MRQGSGLKLGSCLLCPGAAVWAIYYATEHYEPHLMHNGPPARAISMQMCGGTRRRERQVQGGTARIGGGHSISGGSVRGADRWGARFAKSDVLTEMRGAAF